MVDVFTVSIMANVIDLPFTIHSTAMRKPSIKKLWLRERYKSRRGNPIAESRASNTNRTHAPMPGGAVLPEPLASNPFDRQWSVEGLNESADCQVFNPNLAA